MNHSNAWHDTWPDELFIDSEHWLHLLDSTVTASVIAKQLSWKRKLATIKSLKADVSSVSPLSERLSFEWSGMDLRNITQERKSAFWPTSESCLTGVFKSIMANLWINTYQIWNAFQISYISHNLGIRKRFLAACSVLRGASLSTFESFDVARG